jgi:hypothetical protein
MLALTNSFDQLLGEDISTLQESQDMFEDYIKAIKIGGSFSKVFLSTLMNKKTLWKALAASDVFTNSIFDTVNRYDDKTKAELYRKFLTHGLTKRSNPVFRPQDLQTIYDFFYPRVSSETWELLNKLPHLMKSTEIYDDHLLDKITLRYLSDNAPIGYIIQYLYITWHTAPINYELNYTFRNNVAKYSRSLQDIDLIKAINIMFKTGVRHHMSTIQTLVSRIDQEFIQNLNEKFYISLLFVFIKCKRLQVPIDDSLFELLVSKIRSILSQHSTSVLSVLGRGFGELNFGDKDLYSELKQIADSEKGDLVLDYLVKTAVPKIETI